MSHEQVSGSERILPLNGRFYPNDNNEECKPLVESVNILRIKQYGVAATHRYSTKIQLLNLPLWLQLAASIPGLTLGKRETDEQKCIVIRLQINGLKSNWIEIRIRDKVAYDKKRKAEKQDRTKEDVKAPRLGEGNSISSNSNVDTIANAQNTGEVLAHLKRQFSG